MNPSGFSVRRPIFTVMVVLIVVILGGISLTRLPIDLMPDITYPTLSVSTTYPNAGPEEVEELITRPIEEALSAVPGVEEVTSTSAEGSSNVRVTFTWGTDLDAASNDVRDRLDRVVSRLPDEAEKPVLRKFDLASFPVMMLGAYGDLDPVKLRRIIDDQIKYRLERVPGVASLDVRGGLDREIHVNLHPDRIKALGLPVEGILARIRAENVNVPAGSIKRGNYEVLIRTPGEYRSLDELRDTVVAVREGVPIQLKEVAEVEDSWQRVTQIVRVNGKPGVRLALNKQSGTNTVQVAKAALAEIARINEDLPHVHIIPTTDTSKYIERSIRNVGSAAAYGGLLAVVVLLFFLQSLRSTVIIATAIPVSIVATFALMYFGGFTLNIMTLGGLALGVGMLVDNAIVVLENIYRLRGRHADPREAAIAGSDEVAAAIVASTLTTLVVFLPLLFMRGMAGVMFQQLSLVVSFSLLCSLVVALTLIPMLASRLLARAPGGRGSSLGRLAEAALKGLEEAYRRLLHAALGHRLLVVAGAVLLLGGSLALIPLIGSELMPAADEGEVRIDAEMEVGTRLERLDDKMQLVEAAVSAHVPEAESSFVSIGGTSWRSRGAHTGEMRITLKPQSQRSRSSEEIAADLRRRLAGIPGLVLRIRAGQGLFIFRLGTVEERVQVEIRGHDLDVADALAVRVMAAVESAEGVADVNLSRKSGNPEEQILVDRQKAATMKLTVSQIARMLETVLSGSEASRYREEGDEFRIRVQMKDAEHLSLDEVLDLTLVNADGQPVVLRNVVDVRPRTGPVLVERKDQERVVTISANVSGRDLGSILQDIRRELRSIPVPSGFDIQFGGDYEEQVKTFRELMLGLALMLVLVYMVMACQYESLLDPFVVMFSVPLAAIGVAVTLFLTETTFNVQSFIGCIILGGIVVNNAILLVDHTNLLRRRDGLALREAIEEAGRRRLRPILMTALTTILGLVPLALGLGEGGEAQAPMARAVIGGLLSSTAITLVFVPVVYSLVHRRSRLAAAAAACAVLPGCAALPPLPPADAWIGPAAATAPAPGPASRPAGPLALTVRAAVLMALERNQALRVQRLEPGIRRTFEEEERARFDPTLSAGVAGARERRLAAGGGRETAGTVEADAGAAQLLPGGGEVAAGVAAGLETGDRRDDRYTTRLGLTFNQALLQGAGTEADLADIRQARLDTLISEYELRGFTEALVAETEETYWDYALAQRTIEIVANALALAEQQVLETKERILVGKLAETELAAAEAELARRRENLINARSELAAIRLRLLRLLNPGDEEFWRSEVVLETEPTVPDVALDEVDTYIQVAMRLRPDLNQARLGIRRGDLEVVKTQNGLLPRLDLFATLGKSGYAGSFGGSLSDLDGSGYDAQVGLRFDFPPANRASRARHRRAADSREQARLAVGNLAQLVQVDVRSAYIEVQRAREQVAATAATMRLQEETHRVETEKYRVGKSTSFLVAQAQRDLLESQIAQVRAVVSYLKALIRLHLHQGALLERRGIAAPGAAPVELSAQENGGIPP